MPRYGCGAKWLEGLGCDVIIHHIGYDERRGIAARGETAPTPMDQLQEIVAAVEVPVQAVGGLSIEQAIATPSNGAPLVVIGAPLAINPDCFERAGGDMESVLKQICDEVHAYGDVPVARELPCGSPIASD
jgi:3-hexulose-6-phosphate synthase